jgi:hypothetical protein
VGKEQAAERHAFSVLAYLQLCNVTGKFLLVAKTALITGCIIIIILFFFVFSIKVQAVACSGFSVFSGLSSVLPIFRLLLLAHDH